MQRFLFLERKKDTSVKSKNLGRVTWIEKMYTRSALMAGHLLETCIRWNNYISRFLLILATETKTRFDIDIDNG